MIDGLQSMCGRNKRGERGKRSRIEPMSLLNFREWKGKKYPVKETKDKWFHWEEGNENRMCTTNQLFQGRKWNESCLVGRFKFKK